MCAGLLEALVSPSGLPVWLKVLIGPATALALYGYLLLAGRAPDPGERRPMVADGLASGAAR